ncbi:hypothetical protein K8R30_01730 [archaeon]|nr:hypothetical protein [archaeon]
MERQTYEARPGGSCFGNKARKILKNNGFKRLFFTHPLKEVYSNKKEDTIAKIQTIRRGLNPFGYVYMGVTLRSGTGLENVRLEKFLEAWTRHDHPTLFYW